MSNSPRIFGERDRPEIEYPTDWTFKVVGPDEGRLRNAIGGVVGSMDHTLTLSRRSRGGKYVSLELVVTVGGEAQRLAIGQVLHEHEDVKFVL